MGLDNLPLFPVQASNLAPEIDAVFFGTLAVTLFFAFLVTALVTLFAIMYRKGSSAKREPMSKRTQLFLEVGWTTIPLVIGLVLFAWASVVFMKVWTAPKDATDVYVVGKQWMWKIQHDNGKREVNELHVPVGRPTRLVMTSQDVIHSFYIPAFRTKMDVVPGKYTTSWFIPTKAGRYRIYCAEYCGNQHAKMGGWVTVMEPADFARWLGGTTGQGGSLADAGQKQFERLGCATCHREDSSERGPSLKGLYGSNVRLADGRMVKANETYIRESIMDPRAKVVAGFEPVMPVFGSLISDDQMTALLAYVKSLAGKTPATSSGAAQ